MSVGTVASRSGPDPSRPSFECRVYERLPCEIPAKCHPASLLDMKEAGWAALIVDISQGGVRIHLQRRFERGTALGLQLPGDTIHPETIVVFVKVVHLRRADDGTYFLGCRFVSELSEDEVNRLASGGNYAPTHPEIDDVEDLPEELEVAELAEEEIPHAIMLEEDIELAELAEEEEIIIAELAEEEEIIIAELVEPPPPRKRTSKKSKKR
jgi:PilZ domain